MTHSKKGTLIISIIISIIIIVLYFVAFNVFGNKITTKVNSPTPIALESQPRLEDDFYDSINYKYLSKNNIEEDADIWYHMYSESGKLIEEEKYKIISDILSKCATYEAGSNYQKICSFYDSYINSNNDDLVKELNKYIDLIKNSKTIDEYIDNAIMIDSLLGIDILVNPKINSELLGGSKPYFTFDIISYDYTFDTSMGDFSIYYNEVYTDAHSAQFVNYLKKYNISILEEYGYTYDEANVMVQGIEKMYSEFARFSLKVDKFIEKKGYKVYSIEELQNELKHLSIEKIIANYEDIYDNSGYVLVADLIQLKAVDKYLEQDNLEVLKNYAIMQILTSYSKYINENFYKIDLKMRDYFNFYLLGDSTNLSSRNIDKKEYIYASIYSLFKDTITYEFAQRNFTQNEMDFYTSLVLEEIETFKENIRLEDWLSNETKEHAIKKLDNITYTVGIPEEFVYVEKEYEINDNYMSNVISIKQKQANQINKQALLGNRMYGMVDYLVQNAYYSSLDNSINILLGIIYSYKVTLGLDTNNLEKSYYELLGTIGATIGHELTHSLDSNGSMYDEIGNYANWWKDEDKENFDALNNKVIKYYYKYKVFGNQTLGENIADLGGMKLVLNIAEKKHATNENYKTLFESYAEDWCSQSTSYFMGFLLNHDEHSLNKVRVNAVLSSNDKFYEVYNIKSTDKMYVSKEDRVAVW